MRFRLNAHTKANIKKRIQERETTWTIDTSKSKFSVYDNGWRDLTLDEKDQLQGFPKGWSDNHKEIGNAVPPQIVEYIAKNLT